MAFKSARLDDDSLHKVMQGDELVGIKGSLVMEDDVLGSQRMRFQMAGARLEEYIAAPNAAARKGLLRVYVQEQLFRKHVQWQAEPPPLRGEPMDAAVEFDGPALKPAARPKPPVETPVLPVEVPENEPQ